MELCRGFCGAGCMCKGRSAPGTGPRFCAGCFLMPCSSPKDHGTCDGLPLTPWLLPCSRVQVSCDSSSGSRSRTASPKPLPPERDAGSHQDGEATSKLHTGAPHEQGGAGVFALPVPCAEDVLYEVLSCCPCSLQEAITLSMLLACSFMKADRRVSFLVCFQAKMISRAGVETHRRIRECCMLHLRVACCIRACLLHSDHITCAQKIARVCMRIRGRCSRGCRREQCGARDLPC